jgi:cyclin A
MASTESLPVSQLHIIGVTVMYIASKMDEIYPLKIKTIYEKIVHKKISKDALIEMERKIFDALDHKVNCWTFFDLALLKVADQFSHDNVELKNKV